MRLWTCEQFRNNKTLRENLKNAFLTLHICFLIESPVLDDDWDDALITALDKWEQDQRDYEERCMRGVVDYLVHNMERITIEKEKDEEL